MCVCGCFQLSALTKAAPHTTCAFLLRDFLVDRTPPEVLYDPNYFRRYLYTKEVSDAFAPHNHALQWIFHYYKAPFKQSRLPLQAWIRFCHDSGFTRPDLGDAAPGATPMSDADVRVLFPMSMVSEPQANLNTETLDENILNRTH